MGTLVCGIDEAGRGPLAGPVTAAAVILCEGFPCEILADSKKLSASKRAAAELVIKEKASAWAIGWAWPDEIDRYNIHNATLLAMRRALEGLPVEPHIVYVDGKFIPETRIPCEAVIRGDSLIHEIMAASILAKTARDRWMESYSRIEPEYRFEVHKGYPTALHRALVKKLGYSAIHRRSFRIT
jgi:ribonuclease HII